MRKILFACLVLGLLSINAYAGGGAEDTNPTKSSQFADYQSWTKVNSQTITGDVTGFLGAAHERAKGFREIYVNGTGKPVEFGEALYPYPEGTIIVKESYADNKGSKGELSNLTVMVKRESGYSSDYGDWEFIMAEPDGTITRQGRLSMCIQCHAKGQDKDFTFINAGM